MDLRHKKLPVLLALLALAAACQPPEEEPACPAGEVQDQETEACVPEACGTETWGLIERNNDTVHVAPWGDNDDDGTEAQPYRTIQKGANEAGEAGGGLVAVAAGTYATNLDLGTDHDGVEIAGRCLELVVVDGSEEEVAGVAISGGEIGLRDLTVTGGTRGIKISLGFMGTAHLVVRRLLLDSNLQAGLTVTPSGAHVDVEDLTIRDTQPLEDGTQGLGIRLSDGASLTASNLVLERNSECGLLAMGPGTTVVLQGATIQDTQPTSAGAFGRGVTIQEGSSLIAEEMLIEGNHEFGLAINSEGTAEVINSTVRRTLARADETKGYGVVVGEASTLFAVNLLVEDNQNVGLSAHDLGTQVELEDTEVRGTTALADGTGGRGVEVHSGAFLLARNLLIENNREAGLLVANPETTVELDGGTVRDTEPRFDGQTGWGVVVREGAHVVAQGLLLEENHGEGLVADGEGTLVELEDATVRFTRQDGGGTTGTGISVQKGATLTGHGLLLEGNAGLGLRASQAGTSVVVEEVTVLNTQLSNDGTFGHGIDVQEGAHLVGTDLYLEGNRDHGLGVFSLGTTVEITDATIKNTQPLPDGTAGRGVVVQDGATLRANTLVLEGNRDVGLLASDLTTVELDNLRIAETQSAADSSSGIGLVAQAGALVTIRTAELEANAGPGLLVVASATLDMSEFLLTGNGFAGAVLSHGQMVLEQGEIRESTLHPSEGGGLGVFAWNHVGAPSFQLNDVQLHDLPGAALYVRGPVQGILRGCQVTGTGTGPSMPGGVLAVRGVSAWHQVAGSSSQSGLLLEGNTFEGLNGDAVLLDESSATLSTHPETAAPNVFSDLEGDPLVWQRCGEAVAPEVLDSSTSAPSCTDEPRVLGPLLQYDLWLTESGVVE